MNADSRDQEAMIELLFWVSKHEGDANILSELGHIVEQNDRDEIRKNAKNPDEVAVMEHFQSGANHRAYAMLRMLADEDLIKLDVYPIPQNGYRSGSNTILTDKGRKILENYKK